MIGFLNSLPFTSHIAHCPHNLPFPLALNLQQFYHLESTYHPRLTSHHVCAARRAGAQRRAEKTWWAFGISTRESMDYVLVRVFFELERVFVTLQVPILLPTGRIRDDIHRAFSLPILQNLQTLTNILDTTQLIRHYVLHTGLTRAGSW